MIFILMFLELERIPFGNIVGFAVMHSFTNEVKIMLCCLEM